MSLKSDDSFYTRKNNNALIHRSDLLEGFTTIEVLVLIFFPVMRNPQSLPMHSLSVMDLSANNMQHNEGV